MRKGSWPLGAALVVLAAVFGGCIGDTDDVNRTIVSAEPWLFTVDARDETGAPMELVKVTLLAQGVPVALGSTGADGIATMWVPPGASEYAVTNGATLMKGPLAYERLSLTFRASMSWGEVPGAPPTSGLTPARLTDLGTVQYMVSANMASCRNPMAVPPSPMHDCGLSEPSVEVAGDGTVFATGVCCVGGAPPIWMSHDAGESWDVLGSSMGIREVFGIEGDFAIDDAGNMYFFDIALAAIQVSAWDVEQNHLHTTYHAGPPLVDRPWVRAEGDGTVYIVYNQGIDSTFLKSTDHGRTFLPTTHHNFGYGFANPARGVAPGELWVVGQSGGDILVDHTLDGGATWTRAAAVPVPGPTLGFIVPVVDAAGTPYVVFDAIPDESDADPAPTLIYITHATPDGSWTEPSVVGPARGTHTMPWAAAGAPGRVVVAWYGTLAENATPGTVAADTPWSLMLAATLDATAANASWQTIVADPVPVQTGPLGRSLLDFLQVDIAPDGAAHVAYAHDPDGDGIETTVHLATLPNLGLEAVPFLNGPHAPA